MKVKRLVYTEVEGVGLKIKQARMATDRSLEALANEAGITRSYWHDIEGERVRNVLPEATLRRIEQVLGVDLGVSFEGDRDGD